MPAGAGRSAATAAASELPREFPPHAHTDQAGPCVPT